MRYFALFILLVSGTCSGCGGGGSDTSIQPLPAPIVSPVPIPTPIPGSAKLYELKVEVSPNEYMVIKAKRSELYLQNVDVNIYIYRNGVLYGSSNVNGVYYPDRSEISIVSAYTLFSDGKMLDGVTHNIKIVSRLPDDGEVLSIKCEVDGIGFPANFYIEGTSMPTPAPIVTPSPQPSTTPSPIVPVDPIGEWELVAGELEGYNVAGTKVYIKGDGSYLITIPPVYEDNELVDGKKEFSGTWKTSESELSLDLRELRDDVNFNNVFDEDELQTDDIEGNYTYTLSVSNSSMTLSDDADTITLSRR